MCFKKKNKTQTSATRLSGTKLLTHHSLRMCFKLTTLQKTCNHYHRLALPKKNYHCSITYELSPTKVNEWLLLLNPQPLTAHLPQQLRRTVFSTKHGAPRLICPNLGNWWKVPPASGTEQTLRKRKER